MVPAFERELRVAYGVVPCWQVDHTYQKGALLYLKVFGVFAKEGVCRCLYAVGVAAKEDGVEVHCKNLILCIVPLYLYGGNPLLEFVACKNSKFGSWYP